MFSLPLFLSQPSQAKPNKYKKTHTFYLSNSDQLEPDWSISKINQIVTKYKSIKTNQSKLKLLEFLSSLTILEQPSQAKVKAKGESESQSKNIIISKFINLKISKSISL